MGSSESKSPPKNKSPEKIKKQERQNMNLKAQKITLTFDQQIEAFKNKEAKLQNKIDKLKQKAKQYLQADKKKEAKKLLEEATKIKKQLQQIQLRRKVLTNKKYDIETHQTNAQVIDAMENANALMKQDYGAKLEDIIIQERQNKIAQEQINDQLKGLVDEEDDEDVDEMMKELQNEVIKQKKQLIAGKNPNAQIKVPQKQIVKNSENQINAMLDAL